MSNMKRWLIAVGMIGTLSVSALVLTLLGDSASRQNEPAAAQEVSTERTISVNGEGRVLVMPDTAQVSLGVEIRDEDLTVAQDEATERMDAVIQSLQDNGVPENEISTVTYSVTADRDWERPNDPIVGYTVMHIVRAKVQPMENAGDVVQNAVDAGANTVHDVTFSVEDVDEAIREARAQAVEDARDKAEHLATLNDVTLGAPVTITEGSAAPPQPIRMPERDMAIAEDDAASPPIQPGESEVNVHVTISYAIE